MSINIYHVLLTGGVGSRLWPLSRKSQPKQYLSLFSDQSMFEMAIKRNAAFSKGVIVVGNRDNKSLTEESFRRIGLKEYSHIIEATPRNTAPAIAFAAFAAQPDDILLVTPADHIIKEGSAYTEAVKIGLRQAEDGNIVTFGIKPTRPETGYGYIEFEGDKVLGFHEKPDEKMATEFLKNNSFLWNSGMFCFKAGIFLEELQKYAPEVYKSSFEAWETSASGCLEMATSLKIPSISVDYAVMEKSQKIKVVASDFDWSDMGSFEAVYDYLKDNGYPVDRNGNMHIGSTKYTSFVGLQDCILVSTDDAFLVLSKSASQNVKQVYEELEKNNLQLLK